MKRFLLNFSAVKTSACRWPYPRRDLELRPESYSRIELESNCCHVSLGVL